MIFDIVPDDKVEILRVGYVYGGEKFIHEIDCKGQWYNLCTDEEGVIDKHISTSIKDIATKQNKRKTKPVMAYTNWDGARLFQVWENKLCLQRMYDIVWDQPKEILDKILAPSDYRICFCDIETDISDEGFAEPKDANMAITTISMMIGNKVCVLGTRPLVTEGTQTQSDVCAHLTARVRRYIGDNKIDLTYIMYPNELAMLEAFFMILNQSVDVLTGWNFTCFDWYYIYNRCARICGSTKERDAMVARGSVMGQTVSMQMTDRSGVKMHAIRPAQLLIFDYISMFEQFPPTNLASYSLDNVGETVAGIKKVAYNGTLKDLYNNDYNSYVFYNAIDSCIVKKIHDKRKSMTFGIRQAVVARCTAAKVLSKTFLAERLMAWEFRKENKRLAGLKHSDRREKDVQYEGAYVKDPVVGFHKVISCNDFASLYPNTVRGYNIGPETIIGKIDMNDAKRVAALRANKDYILTHNGTLFRKKDGHLKNIMTELFSSRKAKKKVALANMEFAYAVKDLLDADASDKEVMEFLEKHKDLVETLTT